MTNLIIVGAGKVGTRLLKLLVKDEEYNITMVDPRKSVLDLKKKYPNINTIHGDATNKEILEKAGIKEADMIVIATTVDEVNLLIGIMSQDYNLDKIIARTNDPKHIKMFKQLGLNEVVSPELSTYLDIEELIVNPENIRVPASDEDYVLTDACVKSNKYIGKTIGSISPRKDYMILLVHRKDDYMIAENEIVLEKDDRITVLTMGKNVNHIKGMFNRNGRF